MEDNRDNPGPADTLRDGHLKASIWRNEGERGAFYSTTLARTYEDKDGNLRDSTSFAMHDLLRVSELALSAYSTSREMERCEPREQTNSKDRATRDDRRESFAEQRKAPERRTRDNRSR